MFVFEQKFIVILDEILFVKYLGNILDNPLLTIEKKIILNRLRLKILRKIGLP